MSLPLNDAPNIYEKNMREGSKVISYNEDGAVTKIDFIKNGTCTVVLNGTSMITSIDSYLNGVLFQIETFTYDPSGKIEGSISVQY